MDQRARSVDYDGRLFSPVTGTSPQAGATPGQATVARYRQKGDLVWAEFSGGQVRRGSIAGTSTVEGELRFAYCMVLTSGEVVSGLCHSVPEVLADGRIRLTEHWQRFAPGASSGVSALEELPKQPPDVR